MTVVRLLTHFLYCHHFLSKLEGIKEEKGTYSLSTYVAANSLNQSFEIVNVIFNFTLEENETSRGLVTAPSQSRARF